MTHFEIDHYLFNNGPALLSQLEQAKVREFQKKISVLEDKTQFHVLKYWNRRWEYPFILSICDAFNPKGFILDAGAGQSLMPFLLHDKDRIITALDIDDGSFYPKNSLDAWYQKMNNTLDLKIDFCNGNLSATNFKNSRFDFIYSISVLEHLTEPFSGLYELWRILKPGGIIAITIDVSIDDSRGMHINDFEVIRSFLSKNGIPLYPEVFTTSEEMITTDWFKKNEMDGLPWRRKKRGLRPRIKNLLSGHWDSLSNDITYFSSLLVVGLVYRKPKTD